MLPSADTSLKKGGFSPRAAAYLVIGYFLGGVITIQILSRFLHQYMPTEIVDCDHEHEDSKEGGEHHHHKLHDKGSSHRPGIHGPETNQDSEHTPLLSTKTGGNKHTQANGGHTSEQTNGSILRGSLQGHRSSTTTSPLPRRPSIRSRLTGRVSSFMSVEKTMCGKDGPCYGYTDPCGQPYTKYLPLTVSDKHRFNLPSRRWKPNLSRSATAPFMQSTHAESLEGIDEESAPYGDSQVLGSSIGSGSGQTTAAHSLNKAIEDGRTASGPSSATTGEYEEGEQNGNRVAHPTKHEAQSHHHHVPTNAFLSIGLQTSIAIALHKLPEGFITYATNHANPKLGFAVFMALFIHNITEGFAMALPLFLALGSRWKAIFWSSLLGGVSQPLGAGVAALWLKLAGKSDMAPGEGVYGAMFAVTGEHISFDLPGRSSANSTVNKPVS